MFLGGVMDYIARAGVNTIRVLGCLAKSAPLSPKGRKASCMDLRRKSPPTFASTSNSPLLSVKGSGTYSEISKVLAFPSAALVSKNAVPRDVESEAQVYLLHRF